MPLTKRQFELGIDSEAEGWMRQAYRLLAENRDLAYSALELREAILGTGVLYSKQTKLDRALDVLAELGAADKGTIDNTDYYAFRVEFDTNTWERELAKV
jgi:hypothetical protein